MTCIPSAIFIAGIGIGLAVAVPVGPMGVLCIQRTLSSGFAAGFSTGLGAATVHLVFGSLAALGLGTMINVLIGEGAEGLTLVSAGLLFWLAARILKRTVVIAPERPKQESWLHSYASALLFGLSNPLTILLFVGAMPAFASTSDLHTIPLLVSGLFLGSIAWWTVLSTTVFLIRDRVSAKAITVTNRVSGLTLAALGFLIIAHVTNGWLT